MPIYCYETKKGEVIERVFPVGKAPRHVLVKGKKATRAFAAECVGVPLTKGWPFECIASGVNSDQAGELKTHLAKAGVPTHVTPDGNPVYRNATHRRKALKARGLVDKSSYV